MDPITWLFFSSCSPTINKGRRGESGTLSSSELCNIPADRWLKEQPEHAILVPQVCHSTDTLSQSWPKETTGPCHTPANTFSCDEPRGNFFKFSVVVEQLPALCSPVPGCTMTWANAVCNQAPSLELRAAARVIFSTLIEWNKEFNLWNYETQDLINTETHTCVTSALSLRTMASIQIRPRPCSNSISH